MIRRAAVPRRRHNGAPLAALTAFVCGAAIGGAVPGPMPALPSLPPINPGLSSDCVAALDGKAHGAEAARAAHRCSRPAQPGDPAPPHSRKRAAVDGGGAKPPEKTQ